MNQKYIDRQNEKIENKIKILRSSLSDIISNHNFEFGEFSFKLKLQSDHTRDKSIINEVCSITLDINFDTEQDRIIFLLNDDISCTENYVKVEEQLNIYFKVVLKKLKFKSMNYLSLSRIDDTIILWFKIFV